MPTLEEIVETPGMIDEYERVLPGARERITAMYKGEKRRADRVCMAFEVATLVGVIVWILFLVYLNIR